MNIVTISSKYQVTIPKAIREQFNIRPGQKMMFIPYKETLRVVIVPSVEDAQALLPGIDTDPQREKDDREI